MVTKLYITKHPTNTKAEIVTHTSPILFYIISDKDCDPIIFKFIKYNKTVNFLKTHLIYVTITAFYIWNYNN